MGVLLVDIYVMLSCNLISIQSVSDPLKEGHHFDQALGGIAGLFENIRSNTQVWQ